MCAGKGGDAEYGRKHGHTPPEGDDDPAGALALGSFEQDVRYDAVAQQNQQGGSDDFCKKGSHGCKERMVCGSEALHRSADLIRVP